MAHPTLTDIFGSELSTLIDANKAAIATNLSTTQAVVANPESLLAVIIEKAGAWFTAGDNDCGFTIGDQSKTLGFSTHDGDVGFQRSVTFWQPSNDTAIDFGAIE
jgi:glutaminase